MKNIIFIVILKNHGKMVFGQNHFVKKQIYQLMLASLESAHTTLKELPSTLFTEQAIEQCEQFIEVAKEWLR